MRYPDFPQIPEHMQESLWLYENEHCYTGSFLKAILTDDLYGASIKGDCINKYLLRDYVKLIYTHFPIGSFGSEKLYYEWIKLRMGQ